MKRENKNKIVIYQNSSGAIELRGDVKNETIWANRMQMAKMFGVNPQAISKHINNIYKENELNEKVTSSKMELVQNESGRIVKRQIDIYNLDILIAVGYRISSITGTKFRQWATKTLREHITKGYTINRKQIAKNYESFMKAVSNIEKLLPEHINLDPKAVIELIKEFASTWVSLDSYDRESLQIKGVTKKNVKLTGGELTSAISNLKDELIKKGETTDLFATERQRDSVQGIVGNVMQTFGGKPLYETIEEKSANLLYFMVKNHPFIDGNKRSGAFAFIWFVRKTKAKGFKNINPATLTALTLFIAESHPKNKEQMIALITQLLM
ncbi:MAG: virulence protein RhuM/Fic/DOC family protein [Candidatus Nomurabacteria bacterium]|nr:virulence protein RhuM/Fic/DOC family protein [Candidatus Nomurabacteria bacterium]